MNLTNRRQLTDEQLGELLAQCDREVPCRTRLLPSACERRCWITLALLFPPP